MSICARPIILAVILAVGFDAAVLTWPAVTRAAVATMTPAKVDVVVDAAVDALRAYVFPHVGARAIARLKERRAAYERLADPTGLRAAMNADLAEVTHDKHVRVIYPFEAPQSATSPTAADIRNAHLHALAENAGFGTVRRLPGNVGYLALTGFSSDESVGDTIFASMAFVANTDALIIDLRKNGGGDPTAAETLEAYFFPSQRRITSIMVRNPDGTMSEIQQYTAAHVPGRLYLDKPIYLLTSAYTFSCAEQFAYDLQNLKRVTIVGETTGGGANPGGFASLGEGFGFFVPTGRAYSEVTKANWEGTGVKPDVATDAPSALRAAYLLALQSVKAHPHERHLDPEIDRALGDPMAALAQ